MAEQQKKVRPVCPEHWQDLRKKGLDRLSCSARLARFGKLNRRSRSSSSVRARLDDFWWPELEQMQRAAEVDAEAVSRDGSDRDCSCVDESL